MFMVLRSAAPPRTQPTSNRAEQEQSARQLNPTLLTASAQTGRLGHSQKSQGVLFHNPFPEQLPGVT